MTYKSNDSSIKVHAVIFIDILSSRTWRVVYPGTRRADLKIPVAQRDKSIVINHASDYQRTVIPACERVLSRRQETQSHHQSWQASITLGFDWLRCWSHLCGDCVCHHSNDDLKQVCFPGEFVYVRRLPRISACLLNQVLTVWTRNL